MSDLPDGRDGAANAFVELVNVCKTFGATHAVRNVSMALATRGEIHALVGENGAGKSTCLGIASGRLAPSSGVVLINGAEAPTGSPRAARDAGIHAIYQELTIVPALSPAANVFLGNTISSGGWLKETVMRARYEELCARLKLVPSSARRSGSLSVAEQQMLEIARALVSDASAILFDEPTASLAHAERDALFSTMWNLRTAGLAMTLVTHNLDEVLEHSDVVTVFRDGRVVERRPTTDWSKKSMVAAMLGGTARASVALAGRTARGGNRTADVRQPLAVSVRGLASPGVLEDISFDVRPGEIFGIAGLVGSGRSSILRALSGLDRRSVGRVRVAGAEDGPPPRTVRDARRRGIALLPEDRKGHGLVLSRSGAENVTLGEWNGLARAGVLKSAQVRRSALRAAQPVGFSAAKIDDKVQTLSGGNQQKLMLARWLHTRHKVLLADEPTRGVDVGAKAEILASLEKIVADGRSVILVSSELEEVVALSDRVLVINNGKTLSTLDSAEQEITVEKILQLIFAANEELDTLRVGP